MPHDYVPARSCEAAASKRKTRARILVAMKIEQRLDNARDAIARAEQQRLIDQRKARLSKNL